ncbi:MAG TPA: type II CAAX endopeptidase family protein [Thermoanaerobaculia bacterium]|nr:type II CAAX endopeptidase family protein [Thermoanaerobaculia bacterium]
MTRRDLFVFLTGLFAATWALEILAIWRLGDLNGPGAMPYLLACMFLPTVWTLAWLWRRPALRSAVRWRFGRPLPALAGALIPAAVALVALFALVGLGWATSSYFELSRSGVEVAKGPWQLGKGPQSWPFFLLNFAATGILFAVINSSSAVGEEIGWRGLLQGQMTERWGVLGGVTLLGLVWAFWHLPVNLAGYNYGEHPILGGFVLFPLQLVADSFVMAWLTRRSGSFWPAVLYHGSANGILQGVTVSSIIPAVPRLWIDLVVLLVVGLAGALAAWALVREERRTARLRPVSASDAELARAA